MIDKWEKTLNKSSYATADMQRTLSRVSSAIRSPMYPEYSKLQEKDSYFSKLREYEKCERNLTTQEIEKLILSIDSNKNTYNDFLKCVPRLNSATLCSYLVNIPTLKQNDYRSCSLIAPPRSKPTYFQLAKEVSDFVAPYEFKPTDTFALSVTGENILYQLKKEQHMLELAERSLAVAEDSLTYGKLSAKYGRYAAILAFLGIIITIFLPSFNI